MGHFPVVQELARRKAYTFLIAGNPQVGYVATGISRSAGKTLWWYWINLGRVFKEPRPGISEVAMGVTVGYVLILML